MKRTKLSNHSQNRGQKTSQKTAFALISAIFFIVLMAMLSTYILASANARTAPASMEYLRAVLKTTVNSQAHVALDAWLRSDAAYCQLPSTHGEPLANYCGSRGWAIEAKPDVDAEIVAASTPPGTNNRSGGVLDTPLNVGGRSVIAKKCFDASGKLDTCTGGEYDIKIISTLMLVRPGFSNASGALTHSLDAPSIDASVHISDVALAKDLSTADFHICATTEGGRLEDIAPASFCKTFTFSN